VKKVMAIESIPIIVVSDDELAVEVAMDITMVLVAAIAIDVVMLAIDMLSIFGIGDIMA
jgi:hypothetical protein